MRMQIATEIRDLTPVCSEKIELVFDGPHQEAASKECRASGNPRDHAQDDATYGDAGGDAEDADHKSERDRLCRHVGSGYHFEPAGNGHIDRSYDDCQLHDLSCSPRADAPGRSRCRQQDSIDPPKEERDRSDLHRDHQADPFGT